MQQWSQHHLPSNHNHHITFAIANQTTSPSPPPPPSSPLPSPSPPPSPLPPSSTPSGSFGIKSRTGDETSREARWISHRSHREENVAVDHILYCNPSEQEEEKIAPIPDWTNLVYREIIERIIERYGISSMKEVVTLILIVMLFLSYSYTITASYSYFLLVPTLLIKTLTLTLTLTYLNIPFSTYPNPS